jgi:phage-related minor tail protein
MMANTAYMVGEKGPELVIPRHSGTVVNAKQTASAIGGGGNFTQNLSINVTGSDAAMVRTEVAKMIPQITNATKAAVLDAKQRGGQFAAAFR